MAVFAAVTCAGNSWPMYGYTAGNTFWNPEEKTLKPPLKRVWQYRPAQGAVHFNNVTVASGLVFASSQADDKNAVFALDAASGQYQWKYVLAGSGGSMNVAPAISPDRLDQYVFFGGQGDDNLYAVNPVSGREGWRLGGLGGLYSNSPKIAQGALFVNSHQDRSIRAVSLDGRKEMWRVQDEGRQSDIAIEQGMLLRGGTYGDPLLAVHTWSGDVRWKSPGLVGSALAAANGIVFAPYTGESPVRADKYFYRLDRVAAFHVKNGSRLWETSLGDDLRNGPIAVADGVVYVASIKSDRVSGGRGILYALDASSGRVLNKREDGLPTFRMAVANDVVYLCHYNRPELYALSGATLQTLSRSNIGAGCTDLAIANGRLYVAARNQLMAFESDVVTQVPQQAVRGGTVVPPPQVTAADLKLGNYHALVIGNEAYQDLDILKTAIDDAQEVARVLKNRFGFDSIRLLTDATRDEIMDALSRYRNTLTASDNLLIYYAGHGYMDPLTERGYWQPVDARRNNPSRWIATEDITNELKAISALHVLVVADSCYSGAIARSSGPTIKGGGGHIETLRRLSRLRSRTVLTSGQLEPVMDSGGGRHSVFAKAFLDTLRGLGGPANMHGLFDVIRDRVVLDARQTPVYGDIRFAGHEFGDFILLPRGQGN